MGCSDAPKPIVNAFLRPSIIFFPTVFISYIYIQGDPKRYVPMKISIVALIKKLFISNYNHTLFSSWKTIHQSFSYLCQFLVNVWLSQDVFQMSTISLQANLYSSGKVLNHFYTLLFRDGSYFCCDGSFQFFNCLWISLVYIVFEETPQIKIWGVKIW